MRVDIKELRRRVGQRLRERREEQGLTREALEELSDVGAHFIGNVERGENLPSLKALLKLANALEVDPAYFFQAPDLPLPRKAGKRERLLRDLVTWGGQAEIKSLELLLRIAKAVEKWE